MEQKPPDDGSGTPWDSPAGASAPSVVPAPGTTAPVSNILKLVPPPKNARKGATRPDDTQPDLELMEKQYSAGVLSARQIGEQHGCSHTQVQRTAKKLGWTRDLSVRIKTKADAMVAKELTTTKSAATEKEMVAAGAEALKTVKQRHRKDLLEAQAAVKELMGELRGMNKHGDKLGPWVLDLLSDGALDGATAKKLLAAVERAIALDSRAGVLKSLADTLTKLVSAERDTWGMNEPAANVPDPKPAPDMAKIDPAEAGMAYQEWANGTVGYGTKGG